MADRASKRFIGAVPDQWQMFSNDPQDYTVGPPIGFGASSTVYAATYHPKSEAHVQTAAPSPCALKVLDLDVLPPHALRQLQRETQLMSLSKHPHVLRVRGSWIDGHRLYIALRLMNKGSAADVMRYAWPGGMDEDVVRCILKQALEGLNYLHINGFVHRDVKAANLLIDDDGTVLLGDLGVAASLGEDTSDPAKPNAPRRRARIGKRLSFVGTPCWMAPEVIEGKLYDASADIWSFGITAIELSQGRPPHARESSQAALLRTVQAPPPALDRDGGVHKYSKAFEEVIQSCLVKDPSKRPNATALLATHFFHGAKKKSHLVSTILESLPPLVQRLERVPARRRGTTLQGTVQSWDFTGSVGGATLRSRASGSAGGGYAGLSGIRWGARTGGDEGQPDEVRVYTDEPGEIARGDAADVPPVGSATSSRTPSPSPSLCAAAQDVSPISSMCEPEPEHPADLPSASKACPAPIPMPSARTRATPSVPVPSSFPPRPGASAAPAPRPAAALSSSLPSSASLWRRLTGRERRGSVGEKRVKEKRGRDDGF